MLADVSVKKGCNAACFFPDSPASRRPSPSVRVSSHCPEVLLKRLQNDVQQALCFPAFRGNTPIAHLSRGRVVLRSYPADPF